MEILNAFIHEIINMSWFPCCWSVTIYKPPGETCTRAGRRNMVSPVASNPSHCENEVLLWHIITFWTPAHLDRDLLGYDEVWQSLTARFLCVTDYAWVRKVGTGKEENELYAQVNCYLVCNWEAHSDSQTHKYLGSHKKEEGSGVQHRAKLPANSTESGFPLGTLESSVITSPGWPHHITLACMTMVSLPQSVDM